VVPVCRQAASLCSEYDCYAASGYEINNDLWGQGAATSGSQCIDVDSTSSPASKGTRLGCGKAVKTMSRATYVNAGKQFAKCLLINRINSMPTSIQWIYNTLNNTRANVAYNVFITQDPNHVTSSGDYELIFW
jgi:xyloglucan-specific endo-beta-1,4-glucanase